MKLDDHSVDEEAITHFLAAAIDKANTMVQHIDDQTNIIIGVGIAAFVFATTKLDVSNNKLTFLTLGIFTALSALVGLFALHPPKRMRKKGQKESLLFPSHIASIENVEQYVSKMKETVGDITLIIEHSSTELYNISRYYFVPKRRLYKIARNFLLIGILLSLCSFVLKI